MKIRKAVFPVAGLGTRVLPATKAMPKEMLTIVDKPLIQYVYDEAREAGIEHFIFVTGRNKGVIEDHFDRMFELDTTLAARGNKKAEQDILARDQPAAGATSFTRQQAPLGLGHAVWCARDIVGDEPFAVVLPDELVLNSPGCLKQMIDAASELGEKSNLLAVEGVPDHLTHQYGICGVGKRTASTCSRSTAWWRNRQRAPRRPTSRSPGATSCSRRSSRFSKPRSAAPAAKSSSPMR